jgi:molybdopterin/thiamine biosynthesis adenylyltransferase
VTSLPPPNLRLGISALSGIPGVEILELPTYDEEESLWVLRIRLTIETSSDFVSVATDWYVLIDSEYPSGRADFHPAQEGGIHATFRHMKRNLPTDRAWQSGVLCLDRPGRWLGNAALSGQPNDAVGKLRFFVGAALRWLDFAARDALTEDGERFELPSFAGSRSLEVIGFDESPDRFTPWTELLGRAGRANVRKLTDVAGVVEQFTLGDAVVQPSRWGVHVSSLTDFMNASWITLPSMPVVAPWAAPRTWGEFRTVVRATGSGLNLDELLKIVYRRIRQGDNADGHVLLVGFPIPHIYDRANVQMHWQPLLLPEAVCGSKSSLRHARDKLVWMTQRARSLHDDAVIEWLSSENWSENTLSIRGRLHERLCDARIALVGGGALGSSLAEMLVREGCRTIDLFENDEVQVGNLRRHTLALNDIGRDKGSALAERLNAVSPFARVRAFPRLLDSSGHLDELRSADIIVDCTADEDAIATLARKLTDGKTRWFFSGAFGVDAEQLFLYSEYGLGVDVGYYHAQMAEALARERRKIEERGLNDMQNAGCWNPVFPAKWSAIQARATEMLNAIEAAVISHPTEEKTLSIIPPAAA